MFKKIIFAVFLLIIALPAAAQDVPLLTVSYKTALIPREYSLNVYDEDGWYGSPVIDVLLNGVPVEITGPGRRPNEVPFVPISYGDGLSGWVPRHFITGYVDPAEFCDDVRVSELIAALQEAVRSRDSAQLAEIVSPRGLYLAQHSDARIFLPPEVVATFFEDTTSRSWQRRDVGLDRYITESLALEVADKLQRDLLPENITITCNRNQDSLSEQTYLYAVQLPGYEAQNFYSIMRPGPPGNELDWGAWGIVIEYWDDEPIIMALGYYVWFP
jgi:hypothetical protein